MTRGGHFRNRKRKPGAGVYDFGSMLKEILPRLVDGQDITAQEAAAAVGEIMDGAATPAQIAAFATALRIKGETVAEITGCARAMRDRVVRIAAPDGVVLDTCGTG